MSYVDEKIAKVTLDNKAFTKNAEDTINALDKLKQAFSKAGDTKMANNIEKEMSNVSKSVGSSVDKSESFLSKLSSVFKKTFSNVDMSGASKSIDKMNTDIANKTARTSDILSRLKGIFQKADASEGFPNTVAAVDKLNSKVASFDASPLSSAFSSAAASVQNSISVMDIALGNFIANGMSKMVGFGKQFLSGPADGYAEYANKMTSIQTIASNTESAFGGDKNRQMLQINRTLADLNEYADQTIYSFEDMTRNIGTFTAAGVGLEDSAIAIKGISNLAAASGSSTQQASSAMYQLSQALAAGKVGLMDWNSVVNAGMGGEIFKNELYKTAEALGVNVDRSKTFRDSLQDGWVTSEVLLQTLKKFAANESMIDAATKVKTFSQLIDTTKEAIGSGWSETWEHVFGGLEEAKSLWSGVAKEVAGFLDDNQGKYFDEALQMERNLGNFRNAVLKTWKDNGGQKAFHDAITDSVSFLMKSMGSVRSGFRSAFGDYKTVAENLTNATKKVAEFTERLKNNQNIQQTLTRVGSAFGETFKTVGMILGSVFKGMSSGSGGLETLRQTISRIAEAITNFMQKLQQNKNVMEGFQNIGQALANVFGIVTRLFSIGAKVVGQFLSAFNLGDGSGFTSFTEVLVNITESIIEFLDWVSKAIDKFGVFKTLGSVVAGAFNLIGSAIKKLLGNSKSDQFSGFFDSIGKAFGKFGESLANFGSKIGDAVSSILPKVKSFFSGLGDSLKNGFEGFKSLFKELDLADIIKGAISAFALTKYASILNPEDSIFTKIQEYFEKDVLDKILASAKGWTDQIDGILGGFGDALNSFSGMVNAAKLLIIAAAVLALAISMEKLSKLDMKDLSKGMIGMGTAAGVLMKGMQKIAALSAMGSGVSTAMIAFAIALRMLVGAMIKASELDSDKLGTAVGGMVSAMMVLVVGMKGLEKVGNIEVGMMKMIGFAASMYILASALAKLKVFEGTDIIGPTMALISLMVTMARSLKILDGVKVGIGSIVAMISIATSLRILASALSKVAEIEPDRLAPSVLGLITLMIALSRLLKKLDGVKVGIGSIISLTAVVVAIHYLVIEVEKLSKMKFPEMVYAIGGLAALLLSLSVATKSLDGISVSLGAIVSLMAFTASAYGLVLSIEKLTKLPLKEMLVSLGVVEVLLASLVALTYLIKNVKVNLGGVAAILAFSASVYAIVASMEKIAAMELEKIISSMVTVESVLLSLVVVSRLIKTIKINPSSMGGLIVMVGSVVVLVETMQKLSNIESDRILASAAAVSGILLSLAAIVKVINTMADGVGKAMAVSGVLVSFGELLNAISGSLTSVAEHPWEKIAVAAGALFTVLGALSLLAISLSKVGLEDIGAIVIMSEAMKNAAQGIASLAGYDWVSVSVAAGAMIATIAAMTIAMRSLQGVGMKGTGNLVAMGVAMMAIAVPIKILSSVGWVGVAAGLAATAGSLTLFMIAGAMGKAVAPGLMALSGAMMSFGAASLLSAASFMMTATSFALITAAIANLIKIAPEGLRAIVEAFNIFVQSLGQNIDSIVNGLVTVARSMLNGLKQLLPELVTFGFELITNIIKGLTKAAPELVTAAVEFVVEFAKALVDNAVVLVQTAIELVRTLANGILDAIPQLVGTFAEIAIKFIDMLGTELGKHSQKLADAFSKLLKEVVVILTPLITEFFGPLADEIVTTFAPIIQKVIDLVVSAAPVLVPLIETIGAVIITVANGIVRIVEAVVPYIAPIINSVTGLVQALAPVLIALFQEITTIIQTLAPVVITLINGIVTVVTVAGGIINNVINGIVTIVTVLGTTISNVAFAIVGALNAMAGIVTAIFNGIATVISAVGSTIQAILSGLGQAFIAFGTGVNIALQGVATVVESVGTAVKSALEGVGTVVESVGTAIKSALEGIGQVFKDIGTAIHDVCTGISEVVESIGGAIEGVLNSVAGIFESMGNAAEKAGRGFKMVGEGVSEILQYSLGELVSNLGAVADVIIRISNNSDGIASAGSALRQIGQGLTSITTSGTMAATILTTLSTTLPVITQAVTPLPAALQQAAMGFQMFGMGIQNGIIMAIPMAMMGLQQLMMSVQTTGMMLQQQGLVVGQGFGTSIGTGISAGIPTAQMNAMMLGQGAQMAAQANLNPMLSMGIGTQFGQGIGMGIGTGIPTAQANAMMLGQGAQLAASTSLNPGMSRGIGSQFGGGISSGIASQSGAARASSTALAQGSVGAVRGGFAPAQSLGSTFGSGIRGGISSQIGSTTGTSRNLAQGSVQAVRGGFAPAQSLGSQFGSGIATGIRGQSGNVSGAGSAVSNAGKSGAQSVSWYSSGSFLGQGLANGISSMAGHVMSVAANLAARAANAIKSALNIHSPSRVTYAFGEFFSEGFINGIVSLVGQAVKTSTTLAKKTVDAIAGTGEMIQSEFSENLDFNPTITPVVDLSNMKKLDNMYNGEYSVGMQTRHSIDPQHYRNQNGVTNSTTNHTNEYQYDINVNVSGSQATNPREIAKAVQTEIKRMNDRAKVGRGEQPIW